MLIKVERKGIPYQVNKVTVFIGGEEYRLKEEGGQLVVNKLDGSLSIKSLYSNEVSLK